MRLTYYGHSCFLLEASGSRLLIDPYISPNPLLNQIRESSRIVKDGAPKVEDVKCDYVLISHGHEDHMADAEAILRNTNAKLVSNFEIVTWFQNKGIEGGHPMNHGGKWNFDFGVVEMVNAVHSSMLPDGSYGGSPVGFVISAEGKSLYYAGDTALTLDMQLIKEKFTIDLAVVPIGDNFTMGAEDAARACNFVGASKAVGMHYDTFGYIEIDHKQASDAFAEKGVQLTLMKIGESLEV